MDRSLFPEAPRQAVEKFGDARVTYAVFMRRPVMSAPRLAVEWLQGIAKARNTSSRSICNYAEGRWVGAGEPIMYITGSFVAPGRSRDRSPA